MNSELSFMKFGTEVANKFTNSWYSLDITIIHLEVLKRHAFEKNY